MRITLRGHSGAEITLFEGHVYKKVKTQPEYERLVLSVKKQIAFVDHGNITAPRKIMFDPTERTISMPFIPHERISDILANNPIEKSYLMARSLFLFLNDNINNSKLQNVSQQLMEKVLDIHHKIRANTLLEPDQVKRASEIVERLKWCCVTGLDMPIGYCHGDFTFTNMLIQNDKIHLIDFLDVWIDSPLLDLAKLQQEEDFAWSNRMFETDSSFSFVWKRMFSAYKEQLFRKFPDMKWPFSVMVLMNHLRLLQYEKDKNWANRILYVCENPHR